MNINQSKSQHYFKMSESETESETESEEVEIDDQKILRLHQAAKDSNISLVTSSITDADYAYQVC